MMLQYPQTIATLRISHYLAAHKQLLDALYSGTCLLIAGPGLAMRTSSTQEKAPSLYLGRLLEGMVAWCIREKIIDNHAAIENFERILRKEAWTEVGYTLEEYLIDKTLQLQCLQEVIHDLGQVNEIHKFLAGLPFLGYITTTYDTFIETASIEEIKCRLPKFYSASLREACNASQNRKRFMLKLYGDIENPASIALGSRFHHGFLNVDYQDELRKLLSTRPVLFIGFEQADPDLKVLKKLVAPGNKNQTSDNRYWIASLQELIPDTKGEKRRQAKNTTLFHRGSESLVETAPLLITTVAPSYALTETAPRTRQNGNATRPKPKQKPSLRELNIPITIFIAYAREDMELLTRLEKWLKMLKYHKGLNIEWKSCEITETWKLDISDPLNTFNIVLLLFSPDFCASEYSQSQAMRRAVKRHGNGAWISPVLLRPCFWNKRLFGKLPFFPSNQTCVTLWSNIDAAFQDVASCIERAIEHLKPRPRR